MKQSVPWSVKGVEPDARETAKELARRQGMTLGQWLNTMIAEQTAETDSEPVEQPSPLDDLASRLSDLNRRASSTIAGGAYGAPPEPPGPSRDDLRQTELRTANVFDAVLRRASESEGRTARLIENLARTNRETEARTANALAAVAKWIEAAERVQRTPAAAPEPARVASPRLDETVGALVHRLEQIESRLPSREEAIAQPVRAAIERLEERLAALTAQASPPPMSEALARSASDLERRLADLDAKLGTTALQKAAAAAGLDADHAARIEAKLSRILETLSERQATAAAAAPAPAAQPAAEPAARVSPVAAQIRSLDKAIAQIGRRQAALAEEDEDSERLVAGMGRGRIHAAPSWPPRPLRASPARPAAPATPDPSAALDGIKEQIAGLGREIAGLRRSEQPAPDLSRDPAIAALRQEVAMLGRSLKHASSTDDIAALRRKMDELAERVEGLGRHGADAPAAGHGADPALAALREDFAAMSRGLSDLPSRSGFGALEQRIEALANRIDEMRRPAAAPVMPDLSADPAIVALRQEIAAVSRGIGNLAASQGSSLLEQRVGELAERVEDLRQAGASAKALRTIETQLFDIANNIANLSLPDPAELEARLKEISDKVDLVAAQTVDFSTIQRLQREAEAIRDLIVRTAPPEAFDLLARRIDDLGGRLDRIQATIEDRTPMPAAASTAPLEAMIRDLAERMESAQRPGADERSLDALEQQINRLADRLDSRPSSQAPDLSGIERSLGDLFLHLQETKMATVGAADGAASRAVREAIEQLSASSSAEALSEDLRRHLDDLRAEQEMAGRRAQVTLEAVQSTLEQLAERMNRIEVGAPQSLSALLREASAASSPAPDAAPQPAMPRFEPPPAASAGFSADLRAAGRPAAPKSPVRPAEPSIDPAFDLPLEPGSGGPGLAAAGTLRSRSEPAPSREASADPRAAFIAAARRAAQMAATEASGAAEGQPNDLSATPREETARPRARKAQGGSALGRARDLYRRRKRPILLGLAALVLALGTIQVAKLALPSGETPAAPATGTASPLPTASSDPAPAPAPADPAPAARGLSPESATAPMVPSPGTPAATPPAEAEKPQSNLMAPPASAAAASAPGNPNLPQLGVPSLSTTMTPAAASPAPAPMAASAPIPDRLQAAAKAGDARALFDLASRIAMSNGPDRDLSLVATYYRQAAEKGFVPAQYRLGSMYEKGVGLEKDLAQAKIWYERAAAKGNVKAMHNMAVLYAEGAVGGRPDYAMAADWFRQAAEHGLRDSEYNYAILLARGLGSAPDLTQAYKWFALAAAQGDADAGRKRDDVAKRLDAANLQKAKGLVAAFRPQDAPALANEATLPKLSWTDVPKTGA